MKKYTIKDIAELAGVSKGTVDRVIHNRGKVSQKALDKVNKLLEEIDYQPNPMARNLKNNKVYQICVVLPNPDEDNFWEACINGVNQAVEEFKSFLIDIKIFFFSPSNIKSFEDVNNEVLNVSPDAVLLTPLFYKESITANNNFKSAGIIVSTFNNQIPLEEAISFVGQDLYQSGRVAAKLMDMIVSENSHIIICHIDESYNNAIHIQKKEGGFRDYFEELKDKSTKISTLNTNKENLNKSLSDFLNKNKNVTGVFVTTSKAYNVVKILQEGNNNEIKVIGYDLLEKNINFLERNNISFLIHQGPKKQIHLCLTYLIEHFLFNKDIPNKKLLPIDIVNSENLSSYLEN